ncbi:MAG: hypothetical protein U9R39_06665 [Campylobacterota bacterium]|nr:hypothetical protein [Campylobacterota bacterium]
MKKITMSIVFIISILMMSGCAGKNFTWHNASTVKIGDSGKK